jgi:hypothetical protein
MGNLTQRIQLIVTWLTLGSWVAWVFGFMGLTVAIVVGWAFAQLNWFWNLFQWAGVLSVVLVSWLMVGIGLNLYRQPGSGFAKVGIGLGTIFIFVMIIGLAVWAKQSIKPGYQSKEDAIFDIEEVVPTSQAGSDSEWIEITALLRFKKAFQAGEIALFAHPGADLTRALPTFLVYKLPVKNFLVGETLKVPIATVFVAQDSKRPSNDFWGNSETAINSRRDIVGATENVAEIQLTNGTTVSQRFKVFFATLRPDSGGRGRVFLLPENRQLF